MMRSDTVRAPRIKSYLTILLSWSVALQTQTSYAKPLEDVLNSDLMRNFESQGDDSINRGTLNDQLPDDSNIRTLFIKKSGPLQLNLWGAPNDKTFLARKQTAIRRKEYVMAERAFSRSDGLTAIIQTYVAHPHYSRIADLGLLPELASLRPPALETDFSLPVTIQGIQTTVYRTKSGGIAFSLPIQSGAFIHVTSPRWEDLSIVLGLAEKLDIARLRNKLTS